MAGQDSMQPTTSNSLQPGARTPRATTHICSTHPPGQEKPAGSLRSMLANSGRPALVPSQLPVRMYQWGLPLSALQVAETGQVARECRWQAAGPKGEFMWYGTVQRCSATGDLPHCAVGRGCSTMSIRDPALAGRTLRNSPAAFSIACLFRWHAICCGATAAKPADAVMINVEAWGLQVPPPDKGAGIEASLIQVCLPVTQPEGQAASMVDLQPHADPDGLAGLVSGHRPLEGCHVAGGRHFLVGVSTHTWKAQHEGAQWLSNTHTMCLDCVACCAVKYQVQLEVLLGSCSCC